MPGTMFIQSSSLAVLPTSGTAWSRLVAKSTTDPGAGNLGIIDQTHPLAVFSIALRWAKDGGGLGKQYVIDEIKAVMGTESSADQPLNPYRTIGAYIMAADLVDMPGSTVGANGQTFNAWVQSLPNKTIPGQANWNTMWKCADTSANNWGACARTSALACALWMIKQGINPTGSGSPATATGLRDALISRFKRWCGDTTQPNTFARTGSFQDAWAINTFPTAQGAINPASTDAGRAGAQVEDASRSTYPTHTGAGQHYQYESLDSAMVMITLLVNAGFSDAATYGNSGVKRNYQYMIANGLTSPSADYHHFFWHQPWMANYLWNLGMSIPSVDGSQRRMLTTHTDWLTSSGSTWVKVAGSSTGGTTPDPTPVVIGPSASFTATVNGQVVTVDASASQPGSAPISSIEILYGDGTAVETITGSARTDTHTYVTTVAATYQIRVTVIGSDGGRTAATPRTVTVGGSNGAPVAVFAATGATSGVGPLTVTFSFAGSFDPENDAPISGTVDWGDGTTPSTIANVVTNPTISHTFAAVDASTSNTVRATVTAAGLTSTPVVRTVTVHPAPTAAANAVPLDGGIAVGGRKYYIGRQLVVLGASDPVPTNVRPGAIIYRTA